MTSAFDSQFATDVWPALAGLHGQSVTLTAADASTLAVTAIVGESLGRREEQDTGADVRSEREITCLAGDISSPETWVSVSLDGDTWRLTWPPIRQDGATITWQAVRVSAAEVTKPQYRGRG